MGGGQSYNKEYEEKINELKREMLKMKETIEDYKKKNSKRYEFNDWKWNKIIKRHIIKK